MIRNAFVLGMFALLPICSTQAKDLDFNEHSPGPLAPNTYIASDGFGIYYSDPVIFDSTDATPSSHPDLVGPPIQNWSGGNLQYDNLGNLIISEDSFAYFIFNFEYGSPITEFGLSFVLGDSPQNIPFELVIDNGATRLATLNIFDFTNPGSAYYDDTLDFANGAANKIEPITAQSLGADQFTQVAVYMGGPGGIASIHFDRQSLVVSSASTSLLLLLGLFGVIAIRNKIN